MNTDELMPRQKTYIDYIQSNGRIFRTVMTSRQAGKATFYNMTNRTVVPDAHHIKLLDDWRAMVEILRIKVWVHKQPEMRFAKLTDTMIK